jgi:hypothetical protein
MNADKQIEELKLQVDDALEAEEMVVQLTERNLALGEVSILLSSPGTIAHLFIENRRAKDRHRGPRGTS